MRTRHNSNLVQLGFACWLLIVALPGCKKAATSDACDTVKEIKMQPAACMGKELQLNVVLTWTRHGSLLRDKLNDEVVLGASYSELPQYEKSSQAVLDSLYAQRSAVATIRGEFVGRLKREGERVRLEIYYGKQLSKVEQ